MISEDFICGMARKMYKRQTDSGLICGRFFHHFSCRSFFFTPNYLSAAGN
jgi:hypothetical protein